MRKIKRGTLKTRSMEIKMKIRLMYMYGAVFLNLLYKSILQKVTQGNRPLFPGNYSVFGKTYHAVHVSFARTVSFGHLPEAHSTMNCIYFQKLNNYFSRGCSQSLFMV
jgi:hypothetical protein